jgi:hypothetical protein
VFEGRFLRVCLLFAAACAFLTLRLAAARCFSVAIQIGYPEAVAGYLGRSPLRKESQMERYPGDDPELVDDDLFGDPDDVDFSIEEEVDMRLQGEQDDDEDY